MDEGMNEDMARQWEGQHAKREALRPAYHSYRHFLFEGQGLPMVLLEPGTTWPPRYVSPDMTIGHTRWHIKGGPRYRQATRSKNSFEILGEGSERTN